jgi:hypothetical protein
VPRLRREWKHEGEHRASPEQGLERAPELGDDAPRSVLLDIAELRNRAELVDQDLLDSTSCFELDADRS